MRPLNPAKVSQRFGVSVGRPQRSENNPEETLDLKEGLLGNRIRRYRIDSQKIAIQYCVDLEESNVANLQEQETDSGSINSAAGIA